MYTFVGVCISAYVEMYTYRHTCVHIYIYILYICIEISLHIQVYTLTGASPHFGTVHRSALGSAGPATDFGAGALPEAAPRDLGRPSFKGGTKHPTNQRFLVWYVEYYTVYGIWYIIIWYIVHGVERLGFYKQ